MHSHRVLNLVISSLLGLFSAISFAGPVADNQVLNGSTFHTGISPGLGVLIEHSLHNKKTDEALSLLDNAIKKDPSNTTLLYKKAALLADQGQWGSAMEVLNKIKVLQPKNAKANKLRKMVEAKKRAEPHNEVGFDVDEAFVSRLSSDWSFASIHYYRLTDTGKYGGHINFARRYGTTGEQYQLEAYPKFSKNLSAALSFSFANTTQFLFPNLQYMIEGFLDVSQWEFSLGQVGAKYIRFSHQMIFNNTGTIGKYIGTYFIWFRPHYYTPKDTGYFELGLRKYFSNVDNFITLMVGAGKLPDLGDLPPLDRMIIVNQKSIGLNGQFALTKALFFKYGVGYATQLYPSSKLRREIIDGSIGMFWRF